MRLVSKIVAAALCAFAAIPADCASPLRISDYYSPWNKSRATRTSTQYIILHTTECPSEGALKKIQRYGEAHYFVDPAGRVYRIIERDRIATHAGRSMWNGRRNIDLCSIGVEVAGYHDRDITPAQYQALRELLRQLQHIYRIPDNRVLCHAMVAYGTPNRWHRRSHRGRKRCGMLFATDGARKKLGLRFKPAVDPDVKSGALTIGDPVLHEVLYGQGRAFSTGSATERQVRQNVISSSVTAWTIAREYYNSPGTVYVFPSGRRLSGDKLADWTTLPAGTVVILPQQPDFNALDNFKTIGKDGRSAEDIAGAETRSETTVYFLPNGNVRRGDQMSADGINALKPGTIMLVGYTYGGHVTANRSAFDICGKRWNYPSTLYRLPDGTLQTGDSIDERAIPGNTLVFFRN